MRIKMKAPGLLVCFCMLLASHIACAGTMQTANYNLDYGQWQGVATALTPYLDAAFNAPADTLGYDNHGKGKIDVIFYCDQNNSALGWMQAGENALHLNIINGNNTSAKTLGQYGSTVAHETAHVLYYNKTRLQQRYNLTREDMRSDVWVGEAIAYYVGDVVYPLGTHQTKSSLGAMLSYYSNNGQNRASWYDSGVRYAYGGASNLDRAQMEAIGFFLGSTGGDGCFARLTDYLASRGDYEAAIQSVYGKPSGQRGTDSGMGVNTLYADYIKYYLGGQY